MWFAKLKTYLQRRDNICTVSRRIIKYGLMLSCTILTASLLTEVWAGKFSARTYELHYIAAELYKMPQAILLVSYIAALVVNDNHSP